MSQGTWCHLVVGRGSRGPGRGRRGPGAARVEEAARSRGPPACPGAARGPCAPSLVSRGENRGGGQPGALSAPLRHPRQPPAAAQTSVAPGPASQASLPGPGQQEAVCAPPGGPALCTVLPSSAVPAGPTRGRDSGDKGPDLARESAGFAPRRGRVAGSKELKSSVFKAAQTLKVLGGPGAGGMARGAVTEQLARATQWHSITVGTRPGARGPGCLALPPPCGLR